LINLFLIYIELIYLFSSFKLYERLSRRRLLINKGLMGFIPRITIWWFLLRSCNKAAPPSLNLLGEIRLLNSLVG
ncbi:NADH-ubiquinone oxidoreductase chain 4-like, partial [Periplaneta americana]|uniref:NADH-ubiquinone oxidoreductase chain 4-like n=1 Tax=Periplaneta americana TaxID=6978 RepID=UPI0037E95166